MPAVRFAPRYGGCRLLSPAGLHLANVSSAKAAWYVAMGLGERLPTEQVVVKLNFEPKGVGHAGDDFYLQIMENQPLTMILPSYYIYINLVSV